MPPAAYVLCNKYNGTSFGFLQARTKKENRPTVGRFMSGT